MSETKPLLDVLAERRVAINGAQDYLELEARVYLLLNDADATARAIEAEVNSWPCIGQLPDREGCHRLDCHKHRLLPLLRGEREGKS